MSVTQDNELRSVVSVQSLGSSLNYHAYDDEWDDYSVPVSESHNPKNAARRYYSNRNKKSKFELIGQDHYRTMIHEKHKKPVPVDFYMTKYYPGIIIRDAVTGNYEKARVGKCDEDLYFKVKLSIGNDTDGHLYYSSPEDYERHWHTDLSTDIKQKWLEKYTEEMDRRREIEAEHNRWEGNYTRVYENDETMIVVK
mgnify:CR=1 FL=1